MTMLILLTLTLVRLMMNGQKRASVQARVASWGLDAAAGFARLNERQAVLYRRTSLKE
jgi:hypothetical protein